MTDLEPVASKTRWSTMSVWAPVPVPQSCAMQGMFGLTQTIGMATASICVARPWLFRMFHSRWMTFPFGHTPGTKHAWIRAMWNSQGFGDVSSFLQQLCHFFLGGGSIQSPNLRMPKTLWLSLVERIVTLSAVVTMYSCLQTLIRTGTSWNRMQDSTLQWCCLI